MDARDELALQEEEVASTVMNIISNMNDSNEEVSQTFNANNLIEEDNDEDADNELISQLLSSNQI